MKKHKKILIMSLLFAALCFILTGCVESKVTAYLNISTETGAGEFALDIFIRSDDDTISSQLKNGIEGVKQSIGNYGTEKNVEFTFSTRQETVQKWDDNEDDELTEDHTAEVVNVKFTFDSLEDLNAKMVSLSNGGEIASTKGFGEFIPNPDGTTTFSYRNKAIEEVVLAMATHVHDDPEAYSGSEPAADFAKTDYIQLTVDDNVQEINLSAYSSFPNRHFEVVGTYVDESKIVTPTPEVKEEEKTEETTDDTSKSDTTEVKDETKDDAVETTSNATEDSKSFPWLIVIVIGCVLVITIIVIILQVVKKKSK